MGKHALLSPSSANKWIACAAAPAAELQAEKEILNIYAAEGTAAHFLASECLDQGGFKLGDCSGLTIYINKDGEACWGEPEGEVNYAFKFPITSSHVAHVDTYLASLQEFVGGDGILMAEQRLDISPITGEKDAGGTSDAVVIRGSELQIHDLKYGMRAVDAYENRQLIIYAAAALEEYSFMYEIDTITLVIHQPRVFDNPSVHTLTLDEFYLLLEPIKVAAALALDVLNLPDPFEYAFAGNHCSDNYCKARLTCPVLLREVENATEEAEQFLGDLAAGFVAEQNVEGDVFLKRLGDLASKIPMVESWCKDIMSRVTAEILSNGNKVPGFKAVLGKKGNRSWTSEEAFSEVVKGMRIKRELIYVEKPVSPAVLDDLKKTGTITEDHWKRLQKVVTWTEPKPTVVPASDKRPEVEKPTQEELAEGFE